MPADYYAFAEEGNQTTPEPKIKMEDQRLEL